MALLLVFNLSITQFQQFSNYYLLLIGEPRVKQIIITPTKKSLKFCKVSKTITIFSSNFRGIYKEIFEDL